MPNLTIPLEYIQSAIKYQRDYDFEYVVIAMIYHNLATITRADYDAVIAEWQKSNPSHERLTGIFRKAKGNE